MEILLPTDALGVLIQAAGLDRTTFASGRIKPLEAAMHQPSRLHKATFGADPSEGSRIVMNALSKKERKQEWPN